MKKNIPLRYIQPELIAMPIIAVKNKSLPVDVETIELL